MEEKKNPLAAATANGKDEDDNRDNYTTDDDIGKVILEDWDPEDERVGYRVLTELTGWIPAENRFDRFMTRLLAVLIGILIFMAGMMAGMLLIGSATAEGGDAWIICQPGDYVNARSGPSRKSGALGRLDSGDKIHLTGESKKGFVRVERLGMEESEGWVFAGYIIDEPPCEYYGAKVTVKANGRVACRKYIAGPRRCWIHDGDSVKVYFAGGGWAVTSKGFIQTAYLTGF